MDITTTSDNTLTIEQIHAEYLVPAQHPSPEQVKAQLDEAVTKDLSHTLAALAAQWVFPADSRVLLIRRLEVDLDVNVVWERTALAQQWAAQIILSLEDIRQGKGQVDNVVWFPDRTAYLAHFLADAADGNAWGKWYYAAFDGLRIYRPHCSCPPPSAAELSYLGLPRVFGLARALDLALSSAAQSVMRAFAWRLPGFASSSLPYLYSNFLAIPASLEDEETRRVVRLGAPPLDFILNLSGMNRSTYSVSWLDERPFALFRED